MLFVKNQNTIKAIEPTFLTKYNNNFQVYTKKRKDSLLFLFPKMSIIPSIDS